MGDSSLESQVELTDFKKMLRNYRGLNFSLQRRCLNQKQIQAKIAGVVATDARFAPDQKSFHSLSLRESQLRAIGLYKLCLKMVPEIIERYEAENQWTEQQVKQQIRRRFEQYRHVKDPRVLDNLVAKGKMELQEFHMHWSQKSHFHRFMTHSAGREKQINFMEKFMKGHEMS